MRPVHRGECPRDDNGNPVNFYPEYALARGSLIERIGEYCSFCESRVSANLAVEHILPKRPAGHDGDIPERVGDWNNFLLACGNCNSHKGTKEFPDGGCMFPDRDDTFSAISYGEGGSLQPSASLSKRDRPQAENLILLAGLNARPQTKRDSMRAKDRRWQHRFGAWQEAKHWRGIISMNADNEPLIQSVVKLALATGFWSIWMNAFKDIPKVREELLSRFPGTAQEYFQTAATI